MPQKFSIITVNLNNAAGLEQTIRSVVQQTFADYQYIVIDGGSTDESVDIIQKYADKIDYWVSETDKGIYNAMNKGIKIAEGEYCLFLNSGDYLYNEYVLSEVVKFIKEEDIIYGNYILKDNISERLKIPPEKITFEFLLSSSLPHTSSFIKKKLFNEIGLYSIENKIVSDWEFFLKVIVKNNAITKYINKNISVFDNYGISNNPDYQDLMLKERERIIQKNFSKLILEDINSYKLLRNKYLKLNANPFIKLLSKIILKNTD